MLNPKDLSNVPAIKYGLENETKAAKIYEKNMNSSRNTIILMQCGMIINPRMPWLSTSPDRKVLDSVFGPGIVEIKCPYTFRNLKPEACRDPKFFCCLVDGKPTLKKDHNYYFQIQGPLGVYVAFPGVTLLCFFSKGSDY